MERGLILTERALDKHLFCIQPYDLDLVRFFVEEHKIDISGPLINLISANKWSSKFDMKYINIATSLIETINISQRSIDILFGNACYHAPFSIVKLLVEKGANINHGFYLFPAYKNDKKIAEFLIEKGIDISRALIEYSVRVYPITNDEFQIWAREQQVNRACEQIDKLLADGIWDFSKPGPIDDVDCR